VLVVTPIGALASELAVRESPEAYRHSCAVDGAVIGVDYLRRSLPSPRGMQHIPGVLIFEIGAFPQPGRKLTLPASAFSLEWKGLDRPETPAEPQLVLAQLLHKEWAQGSHHPHVEASAGTIDQHGRTGGVIFGRPRREPRFPGDPNADPQENRPQPRSPAPNVPIGELHQDELPERIIPLYALEGDDIASPSAGLVYFLYRGKLKKLKKLILHVQVDQATCAFKIRE
jgi:hypothetical protein